MKNIIISSLLATSLMAVDAIDVNVSENNSSENNLSVNYSTLLRDTDVSDFKEVENAYKRTTFSHEKKDENVSTIYNFTYSPLVKTKKRSSALIYFYTEVLKRSIVMIP